MRRADFKTNSVHRWRIQVSLSRSIDGYGRVIRSQIALASCFKKAARHSPGSATKLHDIAICNEWAEKLNADPLPIARGPWQHARQQFGRTEPHRRATVVPT